MTRVTRNTLKAWFVEFAFPTASQFASAWDSFFHPDEDKLDIAHVNNLQDALNSNNTRLSNLENGRAKLYIWKGSLNKTTTKTIPGGDFSPAIDGQPFAITVIRDSTMRAQEINASLTYNEQTEVFDVVISKTIVDFGQVTIKAEIE